MPSVRVEADLYKEKPPCELGLLRSVCLHHMLYYDQLTTFISTPVDCLCCIVDSYVTGELHVD